METTLWLHADGLQDFGISTRPPPEDFEAAYGIGSLTHSNSCLVGPPAPPLLYGTHHTWYGVPGPTTYRSDGPGLVARGLAFDLELDNATRPMLVWHMRSHLIPSDGSPPAVVPDVILRATLREGHAVSVDHRALDTGRLLAQATSQPVLLSPGLDGHPHVTYHETDGAPVYTFRLPLEWATDQARIAADVAFNLRIDVYVEAPLCDRPDEAYLMPDTLAVYTAPDFRPTLTLGVRNPLWVERLAPVPGQDNILVEARAASPWGDYDTMPPVLEPSAGSAPAPPTALRGVQPLEPALWQWNVTVQERTPHAFRVTTASLQGAAADATALFEVGTGRLVTCQGPGMDACKERIAATPPDRATSLGLLVAPLAVACALAAARGRRP